MVQRRTQVSIGDLFDTETIQGSQVHLLFSLLKFRDRYFSVVNCQEVNQLFEVDDFLVSYLYCSLKGQDGALFLGFRFEEGFDSGLSYCKLV
jgi:hypothetical protein